MVGGRGMAQMEDAMTRLYHRTTPDAARSILAGGFRDRVGMFLTDREWRGVWLSDVPGLGYGGELLVVDLDVAPEDLEAFEWVEDGKPYREWLVPAAFIRDHAGVARARAAGV